jgi:hypothetical protein
MKDELSAPKVVDRSTCQAEVHALRTREKEHMKEGDAIAASRRRLPMVEVNAETALIHERGTVTLLDAFEGRKLELGAASRRRSDPRVPYGTPGRSRRRVRRLRTPEDLLQLVSQPPLPEVPGQRAGGLARSAPGRGATRALRSRGLHPAAGAGVARPPEPRGSKLHSPTHRVAAQFNRSFHTPTTLASAAPRV